jgi:hypothetical protein
LIALTSSPLPPKTFSVYPICLRLNGAASLNSDIATSIPLHAEKELERFLAPADILPTAAINMLHISPAANYMALQAEH